MTMKPISSEIADVDLQVLDEKIVLATQSGLPVQPQPYNAVADQLNVSVDLLLSRIRLMVDDGRIRRIGAVPNHYRLGYIANGMTVWDIEDSQIGRAGELIGSLESVSHCYERPRVAELWDYNLFAMLHGHRRVEVEQQADEIKELLGDMYRSHDILFSTQILKKTGLRFSGNKNKTN